jgi:hypothetical protein
VKNENGFFCTDFYAGLQNNIKEIGVQLPCCGCISAYIKRV